MERVSAKISWPRMLALIVISGSVSPGTTRKSEVATSTVAKIFLPRNYPPAIVSGAVRHSGLTPTAGAPRLMCANAANVRQ
jgi:hypothetical protein